MSTNLSNAFYFLQDEKRMVCNLSIDENNVITLDEVRPVEGYTNANFEKLDEALLTFFSATLAEREKAVYDTFRNSIATATDKLLALRQNSVVDFPVITFKKLTEKTYQMSEGTKKKLIDFSCVGTKKGEYIHDYNKDFGIDFFEVVTKCLKYDREGKNGLSGKDIEKALAEFYTKNNLDVKIDGARMRNLRDCISRKFNANKSCFVSTVKTANIARAIICAPSEYEKADK